jgi:anti-sigma B factor antagonist
MPDTPVFDLHRSANGAVVVSGEIDVMSAAALRQTLLRALEEEASATLVVDLSAVAFIDASGVGALVDVANQAAARRRRLTVTRPSAAVRRIMTILGADWPLEIV